MYAYKDNYPLTKLPDHARGLSDEALAALDPPIYHVREIIPTHDPTTQTVVREPQGPPGWDDTGPLPVVTLTYGIRDMTAEEIVAAAEAAKRSAPEPDPRVVEIDALLAAIDAEAIRPLRAVAVGVAEDADTAKLASLEAEAVALRNERAELV